MRRFAAWAWSRRFRAGVVLALAALLVGNRGFRNLLRRALELRRLRREMVALKGEETDLTSQIDHLKKDDFAAEKAVRRELDYLKPGEIEYRFPPPKTEKGRRAVSDGAGEARP